MVDLEVGELVVGKVGSESCLVAQSEAHEDEVSNRRRLTGHRCRVDTELRLVPLGSLMLGHLARLSPSTSS